MKSIKVVLLALLVLLSVGLARADDVLLTLPLTAENFQNLGPINAIGPYSSYTIGPEVTLQGTIYNDGSVWNYILLTQTGFTNYFNSGCQYCEPGTLYLGVVQGITTQYNPSIHCYPCTNNVFSDGLMDAFQPVQFLYYFADVAVVQTQHGGVDKIITIFVSEPGSLILVAFGFGLLLIRKLLVVTS